MVIINTVVFLSELPTNSYFILAKDLCGKEDPPIYLKTGLDSSMNIFNLANNSWKCFPVPEKVQVLSVKIKKIEVVLNHH